MAYEQNAPITMTTSAAVAIHDCLIVDSSGTVKPSTGVASEDNTFIGMAMHAADSGAEVSIRPYIPGTISKVRVKSAVTAGTKVYTMATGEVDDVTTSVTCVGVAIEAATAENDIISVVHIRGGNDDIS